MSRSVPGDSSEQHSSDSEPCSHEKFGALREAYERRERAVPSDRYSRLKPDSLLRIQEVERRSLQLLMGKGISDLSQKRILEVGCGDGAWRRSASSSHSGCTTKMPRENDPAL